MNIAGMRIFKTGLTVFLAALVAQQINPQNQFVILFTALIAMETTLSSTVETGWKRIVSTLVGAVVANLLIYTALPFPLAAAMAVMLLIIVSNRLNLQGSVGISGSVTILILLSGYAGENPWIFTLERLRDTVIAILLSVVVNLLVFRPKIVDQIKMKERALYQDTLTMVEQVYLYREADNLEEYRSSVQTLAADIHRAGAELRGEKSREKLKSYLRLVQRYQAICIYSENLSLMGPEMRVTDVNQKAITDMFNHEEVLELPWDEGDMSQQEVIYNYILGQLILDLREVRRLDKDLSSA